MVDFKKLLDHQREVKMHIKQLKEMHIENDDASIITLSKYFETMDIEKDIMTDIIKGLCNYAWELRRKTK